MKFAPRIVLAALIPATLIPGVASAAPPANDNFADATVIAAVPFTDPQDTTEATDEAGEAVPCASIGKTVWYEHTPLADMWLAADTFGSDYDTVLAVYEGDQSNLVGCNDDTDDLRSEVVFEASAGATYYFQAGGYFSGSGSLVFNLGETDAPPPPPPPPANDNFADAIDAAPIPFSHTVDLTGATVEPDENIDCGSSEHTSWYRHTAAASQRLVAHTDGSDFDTVLAVFADDGSNMIECNSQEGTNVEVVFHAEEGTTYYFQFGGWYESAGTGVFNLEVAPPPPANDDFADATIVRRPLPFRDRLNTRGATIEPFEYRYGCAGIGKTVWYRFRTTRPMLVTAHTFGSGYDTVLAAYLGNDPTALVPLACNDDTNGLQSRVSFVAVPGVTYRLQAGGYFGSAGDLRLTLDTTLL